MAKAAAKKHLVKYESNPFSLLFSVVPVFFTHFRLFAKAFWRIIGIVFGVIALIVLPAIITSVAFHGSILNPFLIFLYVLLAMAALLVAATFIGIIFINLALVDLEAEKLEFHQLIEHSRSYIIQMLGLNALYVLLVLALAISLVGIIFIPYVIMRYLLAQFVLVHENRPVFASVARSGELMHGRLLDMFGLLAVNQMFANVAGGLLIIPLLVIFGGMLGLLILATHAAWVILPVLLLAILAVLFVVSAINFICALAVGERYIQLHSARKHDLKLATDVQSNVLALALFFIYLVFSFLFQMVFVNKSDHNQTQMQNSIYSNTI